MRYGWGDAPYEVPLSLHSEVASHFNTWARVSEYVTRGQLEDSRTRLIHCPCTHD